MNVSLLVSERWPLSTLKPFCQDKSTDNIFSPETEILISPFGKPTPSSELTTKGITLHALNSFSVLNQLTKKQSELLKLHCSIDFPSTWIFIRKKLKVRSAVKAFLIKLFNGSLFVLDTLYFVL